MHLTVCAPMQVSVGDEERATTALQETIAQTYGRT
jgi:hypothetical protein